jgi:hypothetical protein
MAKLTTDEKRELMATLAIPYFEKGLDKESIMVQLITDGAIDKGFAFTEIAPLVKYVGEQNGFILTVEQRRENCKQAIKGYELKTYNTYELFEELVSELVKAHGNPEKWTRDHVKLGYQAQKVEVPKKSVLTKWQEATVAAFSENPALTQVELTDIIADVGIQNASHYSNLVWGLCSAIRNIETD